MPASIAADLLTARKGVAFLLLFFYRKDGADGTKRKHDGAGNVHVSADRHLQRLQTDQGTGLSRRTHRKENHHSEDGTGQVDRGTGGEGGIR